MALSNQFDNALSGLLKYLHDGHFLTFCARESVSRVVAGFSGQSNAARRNRNFLYFAGKRTEGKC
jgi:hypothetical protein